MKKAAVFTFVVCWAVSALSLAEVGINPIPAATVSHTHEFDKPPTTTTKPITTTTTTEPTTTTTTTKPTTTTTTKPTTTTTTTKPTTTTTTTTKPTTTTTTKPITTTTTTTEPTTTTTTKPITTTTTTEPTTTTTTKPTTTTTTKPITTTTTTEPTTTTTTKPTTTTTTKPTTTTPTTTTTTTPAPPKPPPPPTNLTVGNYNLTDKSGMCLRAQMAVLIRLATPKANGTFIVQPKMTKATGSCLAKYATLNLTFTEGFIYFRFNKSAAEVFVDELSFSLYYPFAKDDKTAYTASNKSLRLFPAKIGHSYSCKNESIYLGSGLSLEVNQDRMQAYNLTKSSDFGLPDPCVADKSDYRIAIAVGVTLLILIIIVLVAYLLGRRRKTGGYQPL